LAYFVAPVPCSATQTTNCYTTFTTGGGTALPPSPGVERNSLNGPGYRDVDMTISKAFGFPNNKILGESSRLELRLDAYNVFNNLNFDPTSIANNIGTPPTPNPSFGRAQAALAARVVTVGARFSF